MKNVGFEILLHAHTAEIMLDHPPANTWTLENLAALEGALHELKANHRIKGIVIASKSDKFFSAGADLKSFDNVSSKQAQFIADAFGDTFETLSTFPGVTIAAINGYAMGGGLEVALACDMRFVSAKAKLGLPEAKVGLLPCAGGTQNLTSLVGEGWAKRMILCGEIITGQKAFDIGLAEELHESPIEKAHQVITCIEDVSPDSLVACKELIQEGRHSPRWANLMKEREQFIALFKGKNQKEGVQAFLEKRKPHWHY